MQLSFKNPKTGEVKNVKVGFSWVLFFWSGLLGIPLFLRKLNIWGAVFLALWAINLVVPEIVYDESGALELVIFLVFLGLQIFMGIKGNELTAKNYLENGWNFVDPNSEITKVAKMKWGLVD